MKLRHVNPLKIKVPEVRVTARFNEETASLFKDSVEAIGIDEPIKCYEVEGQLWLSDGKHRLDEALRLNMPTVEAYVREGTMVDVLCNNMIAGHLRGKHPVNEMIKVIEQLYKVHQIGIEQIVKRTGLPQRYVEDLILVSGLTPMGRAALDENLRWFTIGHALAIVAIKDEIVQERVLGQQLLYHWPVAELRAYIKDVLALVPPPQVTSPPPPPPAKIKCYFCGELFELGEVANPNTCKECAGVMLASMAQARRELALENPSKTE